MPKITITFPHLYLLVKVHKSPVLVPSLGANDKLIARDLEDLKLLENREERLFCTSEGNLQVQHMGNQLEECVGNLA